MTLVLENIARDASINGRTALVNSGIIELLAAGDVVIATGTFAATAFATASGGGPASANGLPITVTGVTAASTGTVAVKYRAKTSGDATAWTGDVGAEMTMDNTTIADGQDVDITTWSHGQPA